MCEGKYQACVEWTVCKSPRAGDSLDDGRGGVGPANTIWRQLKIEGKWTSSRSEKLGNLYYLTRLRHKHSYAAPLYARHHPVTRDFLPPRMHSLTPLTAPREKLVLWRRQLGALIARCWWATVLWPESVGSVLAIASRENSMFEECSIRLSLHG